MQFRGHRSQYLIVSLLLMMVCVQSFSMHFHYPGDDEHHSHAHTHAPGSVDADHLITGHGDEASSDIWAAIAKQTLSIDLLVSFLLTIFAFSPSKPLRWQVIRKKRPRHYLFFFQPPLRAPSL